MYKNLIKFD
jgi:serine/threonine protein kinase